MRTTISKLANMTVLAATLATASATFALEDAQTLRCDAATAKRQSRYYGCLADCQERADKRGIAASSADQVCCVDRCDRNVTHLGRSAGCVVAERVPASDLVGLDADTLNCRATASALASRLLRCLADCSELEDFAVRHGSTYDPALCVDACEQNDAAALASAEARDGCVVDEVE